MKQEWSDLSQVLEEGFGIELPYGVEGVTKYEALEPFELDDADIIEPGVIVHKPDDDKMLIGYLVADSPAMRWNEIGCDGEVLNFSTRTDCEKHMQACADAGKIALLIDRYEHGDVHYSVAGTRKYPYSQWDVSRGTHLYVPPDDFQEDYRARRAKEGEEAAREWLFEVSNGMLNTYSDWANGYVYGAVVETWERKGKNSIERVDSDECWGYIGLENARHALRSTMGVPHPRENAPAAAGHGAAASP